MDKCPKERNEAKIEKAVKEWKEKNPRGKRNENTSSKSGDGSKRGPWTDRSTNAATVNEVVIIDGIPMFQCVKCDCNVDDHTTGTHGKWKAAKANKAEFDITKSSPNSPLAKAIVAFGQAGSSNSSSSSSEGEDSSSSEGALTKATIEERLSKMETNMTDSNHVQLVGVMRKALLKD